MTSLFSGPWPWYVTGPLIGLFVPALLLVENRMFGVSANLRHLCSALFSNRVEYFRYDWKHTGLWNLVFVAGAGVGGFLVLLLDSPQVAGISQATKDALGNLGIHDFSGMAPREIFSWSALGTVKGFVSVIVGGFLVGFGSSYAGGCTSGHAISGLADLQLPSLVAVVGFFAGGLLATHYIIPWIF